MGEFMSIQMMSFMFPLKTPVGKDQENRHNLVSILPQ
jgi:hypothetical protein